MEVETEITGRLIDAVVRTLSPDVCSPQMRADIARQLGVLLKTNPTPTHPTYALMIEQAIKELNEEGGSDEEAISNCIKLKYTSLPWGHKSLLSHHLKKLSDVGEIIRVSDGRFVLPIEECDDSPTVIQEPRRTRKNLQKERSDNQHKRSRRGSSRPPEKEVGCEEKGALAEPVGFKGQGRLGKKLMQANDLPNPDVTEPPSLEKILGNKASEEVSQVTKEQAQERTGDAFVERARSQGRQAPPNVLLEPEVANAPGQQKMSEVEASEEICQGFEGQSKELEGADQALKEIALAVEGEREERSRGEEAVDHLGKGGYQLCESVEETPLSKEKNDAVGIQGQVHEESNHFLLEVDLAEMQEACRITDKQNQEDEVTEKATLENQIHEQSHGALLETQLAEVTERQTQPEKQQTVAIGIRLQLLEKEREIEGIEKLIASAGQSAEAIGNRVSLQEKQGEAWSRISDNSPILSCTFPSLRQGGSSISLKDKCLELINRTEKINKWREETDKCLFGIMKSFSPTEMLPSRKSEICVPLKKVISHSMASPDCSVGTDVMMIEAQNSRCFLNTRRPSEIAVTTLENLSLRQEKRPKLSDQQDIENFPRTSGVPEYSQQLVGDREHKLLKASEANYSCETTLSLSVGGSSSFATPPAASFLTPRDKEAGVRIVGGERQSSTPHGAAKAVTFHLGTGEATVRGTLPVIPDLSEELHVASSVLPPQMQHREATAFKERKEPEFEIGKQQEELEMVAQQGRSLARQQHKQLDAEGIAMPISTGGTLPLNSEQTAELLQWRLLTCEHHKQFESERDAIPMSTATHLPPVSYEVSEQERSLPIQWQLEPRSNALPALAAAPRPPINYKLSEQQRSLTIQQQQPKQFEPRPNAPTAWAAVARPQVNSEPTGQQGILSSPMYYSSPAEVTTPTPFSAILSQDMAQQQQQQSLLVSEVCTPSYPNGQLSREHHQLADLVSGLPVIDSSLKPSRLSSGTLTPLKPAELDKLVSQTEESARVQTPKKSQTDGQGSRAYRKKLRSRAADSSPENGTVPHEKEKRPRGRPRKFKIPDLVTGGEETRASAPA